MHSLLPLFWNRIEKDIQSELPMKSCSGKVGIRRDFWFSVWVKGTGPGLCLAQLLHCLSSGNLSVCTLSALVCLRHQKYMNAAKCFRSSLEVENLKVSDLCRIKVFCTAPQHRARRDVEYREWRLRQCFQKDPWRWVQGILCFSDLASLIRECGVRLECNRISKFQGNVMTR